MENSTKHNCDIKCPKCNHTYSYDFKIECTKKCNNKKNCDENLYEFLIYLICKNPLCNYDIEIKGENIISPSDNIDEVRIISIK